MVRLLSFALSLIALIFLFFLFKGWYPDRAVRSDGYSDRLTIMAADPSCNPALEICTANYDTRSMTLRLEGKVKPLVPFSIRLSLNGWNDTSIDQVAVHFAMVGMNMGSNRFELERRHENVWYGQAMLPVCTRGRRDWQIQVDMVGEKSYRTEFYTTVNTGPNPK